MSSGPVKQARTESREQHTVVGWLRARGHLVFAVPNGAKFGPDPRLRAMQMGKLRREGLLPGAPDLVIADKAGPVAVEMKRDQKSKVTAIQHGVLDRLQSMGWRVVVGHGADDAIAQLVGHGL